MNIEASTRLLLDRLNGIAPTNSFQNEASVSGPDFENILGNALNELTQQQVGADQAVQALIMGEDVDMHDVMIQSTEAQLSLELAVQVRNKCIEAFNEMKNMQF